MTTYREAGVDIDAADETVDRIKGYISETYTAGVLTETGAFGGMFDLDTDTYQDPVLVSSIDGVGTKVKVASRMGRFDTIGADLVNHCVNDIAVSGADPLFFLDYYGTGVLDPDQAEDVIKGFAGACKENNCALIGGEIAEMPDVYGEGDFDLVGTVVGVIDRADIRDESYVSTGDVLIGVPSTGLHTNGYTLARTVLFGHFDVEATPGVLGGASVGEELLRTHRSYYDVISAVRGSAGLHGLAHITGGGLEANVRRVIPDGRGVEVDWEGWSRPPIFDLIQEKGDVPEDDMRRTFNLGVGLVLVVDSEQVEVIRDRLAEAGEETYLVGNVV